MAFRSALYRHRRFVSSLVASTLALSAVACGSSSSSAPPVDSDPKVVANPVPPFNGSASGRPNPTWDSDAGPETIVVDPISEPMESPDAGPRLSVDEKEPTSETDGGTRAVQGPRPEQEKLVGYEISVASSRLPKGTYTPLNVWAVYSTGKKLPLADPGELHWSSSHPEVASIHSDLGPWLAVGRDPGQAVLTAQLPTDPSIEGKVTVDVLDKNPSKVHLVLDRTLLPKGTHGVGRVIAEYDDDLRPDVSLVAGWSSSEKQVVELGPPGLQGVDVKAIGLGKARLSATFAGSEAETEVEVTAPVVSALRFEDAPSQLPLGTTFQFKAQGTLSDGTLVDATPLVRWSCSDPTLLNVNDTASRGFATTLNKGKTVVTAESENGIRITTEVEVSDPKTMNFELTPGRATLSRGESKRFRFLAKTSEGGTVDLTSAAEWSSLDESVVTVSNAGRKGVVGAVRPGAAEIMATVNFGGKPAVYKAKVTVR